MPFIDPYNIKNGLRPRAVIVYLLAAIVLCPVVGLVVWYVIEYFFIR